MTKDFKKRFDDDGDDRRFLQLLRQPIFDTTQAGQPAFALLASPPRKFSGSGRRPDEGSHNPRQTFCTFDRLIKPSPGSSSIDNNEAIVINNNTDLDPAITIWEARTETPPPSDKRKFINYLAKRNKFNMTRPPLLSIILGSLLCLSQHHGAQSFLLQPSVQPASTSCLFAGKNKSKSSSKTKPTSSGFGGAAIEACPCGSTLAYSKCCGRLHTDVNAFKTATAEAVVRARYSGYAKRQVSCRETGGRFSIFLFLGFN